MDEPQLPAEKRKAWSYALEINQLDGDYQPSSLLSSLMEKEILGEISADEIVKKLLQTYQQDGS